MSDHRLIDPTRAEQLLDGTDVGTDPVGRLLAAARTPAPLGDLHREAAAMAAFRAARLPSPGPRRHVAPARRGVWAQLLGVKAAVAATLLVAAGVAVAAGTGVLPLPGSVPPGPTTAAPPTTPLSSSGAHRSSPGEQPSGSAPASGAPAASPSAAEHASLVGLCHAYQAHGDRDPGEAMGSAAFAALVAAAGGVDQVEAFCVEILATGPGGAPATGRPSPPAGGSGSGSGSGSDNANSTGSGAAPGSGAADAGSPMPAPSAAANGAVATVSAAGATAAGTVDFTHGSGRPAGAA